MKLVEIATDKQLQVIEDEILAQDLHIRLDDVKQIKGDYTEILFKIIQENSNHNTVSLELGEIQCEKDLNRSQTDLFLLMRHYCPEITFKEFRQCILNLLNNQKILSLYCNVVGDKVFHKNIFKYYTSKFTIYHASMRDKWGFKLKEIW